MTKPLLAVLLTGILSLLLALVPSEGLSDALASPLNVSVDIKPAGNPNSINLRSNGVIPVAILSDDFDAASVNPTSVVFAGAAAEQSALEDVDDDGDADLLMHFRTQQTNIAAGDRQACLSGETFGGQRVQGCDSVRIVPPHTDSDADSSDGHEAGDSPDYGDDTEATIGTDQFGACGVNAWPPDINGDGLVDVQDLIAMVPALLSAPPGPPYEVRLDLYDPQGQSGAIIIDVQDLNALIGAFFQPCPALP